LPQQTPLKNKNTKKQTAGCWIGDLNMKQKHKPVLLQEVLRLLQPKRGESYLDGTAGFGGHAQAILEQTAAFESAVLVDRDRDAVVHLQDFFVDSEILHDTYLGAAERLARVHRTFDMILLDLGVSSPQLDRPERGFSFRQSGALDMRMDQSAGISAQDVVNEYPLERLERIIREYGEERYAKRVARAIVRDRPFRTTGELAESVRASVGYVRDIDPATRTFQAIRIEVNDELAQLASALPVLLQLLNDGGRLTVISFHSLEDRIVKNFMHTESRDCICPPKQPICTCGHVASIRLLTRRPITGSDYDAINPRARSAKLRAAEKINKHKKEIIR